MATLDTEQTDNLPDEPACLKPEAFDAAPGYVPLIGLAINVALCGANIALDSAPCAVVAALCAIFWAGVALYESGT